MESASETTPLIINQTTHSTLVVLEKLGNKIENTEETCMDKTVCLRDWCDYCGFSVSVALAFSGSFFVIATLFAAYYLPKINPLAFEIFFLFGASMAITGLIGLGADVAKNARLNRALTNSQSV